MPANILRPLGASIVLLVIVLFSGCKPKPTASPTVSAAPSPVVAPGKESAARSADEIALLEASINGDAAQVKVLLEKGVNPNTKDSDGRTPLTEAAYRGSTEIVRMLIDHGADLFAKKNDGETAITMAAGHPDMASLIKLNLDLLEMAGKGDVKGVRESLEKGASVNVRDPEGRTPLTESVWSGQVQVVKLLLERGANPNLRKNDGAAPLSIANGRGNKEIAEMLKKAGAK